MQSLKKLCNLLKQMQDPYIYKKQKRKVLIKMISILQV